MKGAAFLLLNAALANAHWVTSNFIFDDRLTGVFEYVREISPKSDPTSTDPEFLLASPNTDPTSKDLICGRNASTPRPGTKTATVRAGDQVGFFVGRGITNPPTLYHPGFGSAWLSRVPASSSLDTYEGDGSWYKIHQTAGRTAQSVNWEDPAMKPHYDKMKALWGTFYSQSWNFTIPATTPAGQYLVRWEQIFPNTQDTQFYVNCAHVEVTNEAEAVEPGEDMTVRIPGVYVRGQKDVYFSTYDYGIKGSLDGFVPPKPRVWEG